jgi:hypothetical protein
MVGAMTYRITVSAIAKLFELLVYRVIYEDLKGRLVDCQHGIIKGRSAILNLLKYSSFVLKSIEDGCQMDSIYMDFSKIFDRVRHFLLLDKILATLGVPQGAAIWGHSASSGL